MVAPKPKLINIIGRAQHIRVGTETNNSSMPQRRGLYGVLLIKSHTQFEFLFLDN